MGETLRIRSSIDLYGYDPRPSQDMTERAGPKALSLHCLHFKRNAGIAFSPNGMGHPRVRVCIRNEISSRCQVGHFWCGGSPRQGNSEMANGACKFDID